MKKIRNIILGLLAVVVLVSGAVCVWQWDNIRAVYTFLTTDSEQLGHDLEALRQEQHQIIKDRVDISFEPPSREQSDALLEGSATAEEVKEALGITAQLNKPATPAQSQEPTEPVAPVEPVQPDGSQPPVEEFPPVDTRTEEELVSDCVAELYACQVDIMEKLAILKQEAIDQWVALPEKERTDAKKKQIGLAGLERCYQEETVVDEQVRTILRRYEDLLEQVEGDTSVIGELWTYYQDLKVSEKSYYMDKYMN